MTGLTVTVLVDNTSLTDRYFTAEPGLSLFVEHGNRKYLFDVGYSGIFMENAARMGLNLLRFQRLVNAKTGGGRTDPDPGIDLLDLDRIILSHGHIDHTGGLVPLMRRHMEAEMDGRAHKLPCVLAHPYCFYPRPALPLANIGSPVSEEELARHFPVVTSRAPVWLTDNLVFLGEIPRPTAPAMKKKRKVLTPGGLQNDYLVDDTALAYRSESGLVIITGCSHSGICNIIRYAREVTDEQRILDVIGGFHLMENDRAGIEQTVKELALFSPASLHPCHCTSLAAKIALAAVAPVHETGVGLELQY